MALADIIKKIEEDGAREVDTVLQSADSEVKRIHDASVDEVAHLEETAAREREQRALKVRERILGEARAKAQFSLTNFKNTRADAVFDAVLTELQALDASTYATFMEPHIKNVPEDAQFIVAEETEDHTKALLKKQGVSEKNITVAKKGTLLGGFMWTTDTAEYDASFSGIVKELREAKKTHVAQELFS